MNTVWLVLGWVFAVIFGLLTVSMLLLHNWLEALVLFLVMLLCLPPVTTFLQDQFGLFIHPLLRVLLIAGLLFLFVRLLLGGEATSIYASPDVQEQFSAIYDEKMTEWPVPYEDRYLDTEYGKIHVIVSGPEDGAPLLLLHASGVASWSWKYNIAELSQYYRAYTIDLIGDAGKSELASMDHVLQTGEDQANLYAEIADQLGVDRAAVIGASEGGFIGSNYAMHYPERVDKLILLGPMGYAGATRSVIRIMFAQFFPLKPIQDRTFSWAFSDATALKADYNEWFRLLMTGIRPAKVMPLPYTAEQRQRLQVPVLFVFGERDNLVGDPEAATRLVQDVPDARVEVVNAGHLMAGELPEQVNALILKYLAE